MADTWEVYDNSEFEPFLVAFGGREETTTVLTPDDWRRITEGQA